MKGMKTNKSYSKRLKVTKSGKILLYDLFVFIPFMCLYFTL